MGEAEIGGEEKEGVGVLRGGDGDDDTDDDDGRASLGAKGSGEERFIRPTVFWERRNLGE